MEESFFDTTTDLFSFVTDGFTEYSPTDNMAPPHEGYTSISSTFDWITVLQKNQTHITSKLAVYDYLIPFLASFVIIANSAVVVSSGLLLKKGQQPRCTYLFLGNVAMADLFTGCAIIAGQQFPKHKTSLPLCSLQLGTIVGSTTVSVYSVVLIAVDRFIYIVHGMQYSRWVYPTRARIAIAVTWGIGLLFGFLPVAFHGETDNGRVCWFILYAPPEYIAFIAFLGIAPVVIVCTLYSIILYHAVKKVIQLKKMDKEVTNEDIADTTKMRIFRGGSKAISTISESVSKQDQSEAPQADSKINILRMFCKRNLRKYNANTVMAIKTPSNPSKWKAIKIVFLTTGSFVATWLPYFIACVCHVACDPAKTPQRCFELKYAIASPLAILGFVNSLLNPVIYAWWHKGFRKSLKMMCSKKKNITTIIARHPQVVGMPSTAQSSPQTSSQIIRLSTINPNLEA